MRWSMSEYFTSIIKSSNIYTSYNDVIKKIFILYVQKHNLCPRVLRPNYNETLLSRIQQFPPLIAKYFMIILSFKDFCRTGYINYSQHFRYHGESQWCLGLGWLGKYNKPETARHFLKTTNKQTNSEVAWLPVLCLAWLSFIRFPHFKFVSKPFWDDMNRSFKYMWGLNT